ncbi:hypothetical protein [Rikenella microfusus]|uniref:hypothetical protein n=1 Tax=Rikenella microfusus TaxID=28139 RepID=UPI0006890B78|nr:hypothetical protein [Rikenella microfusus]
MGDGLHDSPAKCNQLLVPLHALAQLPYKFFLFFFGSFFRTDVPLDNLTGISAAMPLTVTRDRIGARPAFVTRFLRK